MGSERFVFEASRRELVGTYQHRPQILLALIEDLTVVLRVHNFARTFRREDSCEGNQPLRQPYGTFYLIGGHPFREET